MDILTKTATFGLLEILLGLPNRFQLFLGSHYACSKNILEQKQKQRFFLSRSATSLNYTYSELRTEIYLLIPKSKEYSSTIKR